MFDALINEISQRFGLGDKAQGLIASLLGLIFNQSTGGIAGLLDRFKQQGLSSVFSSWLGGSTGQPAAINAQQVESVLGSSAVTGVADKLGIARGTVLAAASAALPKIIGLLTPNGSLPTGIPSSVSGLIGGLGSLGGAASAAAGSAARSTAAAVDNAASGGLGWLKWLVLAAVVLGLGYCVLNRKPETVTVPTVPAVKPAVQAAVADAKSALSALIPGQYTGADLVKALNLMDIHFDTGSANISADSFDILTAAAAAIKAAPAGTKVEVGGHTDNTGDPAANLTLSQQRADAVRAKLVELGVSPDELTTKGYGDTKPKADNATDAGKATNRRMEFTVLQ